MSLFRSGSTFPGLDLPVLGGKTMLFVTNRVLEEGLTPIQQEGAEVRLARSVNFVLDNNQAEQSFYCCRRTGVDNYTEIGSTNFFDEIKSLEADQLLFYIHGYSTLPEQAFENAEKLQRLLDALHQAESGSLLTNSKLKNPKVVVIPLIWPCDNDRGRLKDYFDDQKAADASGTSYMRLLQRFLDWREKNSTLSNPCLKRVNILAYSMGSRVLRSAISLSAKYYPQNSLSLLFRNVFMPAPDIVNESLEPGQAGSMIPVMSRNVVVYYAADDLALRASKVLNVGSPSASRRLGHTGPENMEKVPRNVYAIDCDDFNNSYDAPLGHAYYLDDPETGDPGLLLRHAYDCMRTGRVPETRSAIHNSRIEILNSDAL
ncbi:MAG: alpha/beta hydrolase [Cyanobacteria bacterium P01_D01_bin.105]